MRQTSAGVMWPVRTYVGTWDDWGRIKSYGARVHFVMMSPVSTRNVIGTYEPGL